MQDLDLLKLLEKEFGSNLELMNLASQDDDKLLEFLLSNESFKQRFFTALNSAFIFKKEEFLSFLNLRLLNASYTKFSNKIGLSTHETFIKKDDKVVLNFAFKDCILKGGASKDEDKKNEIFFNEILAKDEIDVLFARKALQNFELIGQGDLKENLNNANLLIKGNNLLALHSLKKKFANKVKLIYIDPPYNTGNDSFNYNDNFNHSTWLTFMKNRLEIAREFLRDDGVIFIQCDDNEQAYLKVLCDEIFNGGGGNNFITSIAIRSSTPSGLKTAHREKTIIKTKDYILIYAKNANNIKLKPQYTKKEKWDTHYTMIFDKNTMASKKIIEVMVENELMPKNSTINDININDKRHRKFYLDNATSIYRTAPEMPQEQKQRSLQNKDKVISYTDGDGNMQYALNGNRFSFLSQTIKPVLVGATLKEDIANLLCDFWNDIDFQNTQNQGGVDFENAKKPEQLIYRIIDMTTQENDLVMDFFAGSGTTLAVAMKMKRRWIGIEQMDYIESITKERLKKVVSGEQGGISKAVDWQGGGSFIYAELMPLNAIYKERIKNINDEKMLDSIYKDLESKAFLDYRIDLPEILENKEFKELDLEKKKEALLSILDSNMDYVLYGDIEDKDYAISSEVIELNKIFYGDDNV